jgi:hypothetical protein
LTASDEGTGGDKSKAEVRAKSKTEVKAVVRAGVKTVVRGNSELRGDSKEQEHE